MPKLKNFILSYLLLQSMIGYTQDIKMDKEVKEMVNLGRDSIVQLALNLIDNEIQIQNFTKTVVKTNGKEIFVSLQNPIKYLPLESAFYFDIGISVIEKTVNYTPVSNGSLDGKTFIPFYEPTEDIDKNIQFVIESINKSSDVGAIDTSNFDNDMIIRENEDYYDIQITSETQESSYKVQKVSGLIYDAEHAHLIPPPTDIQETWQEIN